MQVTKKQAKHLRALYLECRALGLANAKILAAGGEMIPVRNGRAPGGPYHPAGGSSQVVARGVSKQQNTTPTTSPP